MARSGIVALIVVVVGNVLGGCGEDAENAAPEHHPSTPPTAAQAPSGPKPPHGTLTLGKHVVTGALGSYCWESVSSAAEMVARCADAAGIPVPPEDEALTVPRGWVLVFDYGGKTRPTSVSAKAYPLEQDKAPLPARDNGEASVSREKRPVMEAKGLRVSPLGDRVQIPVELSGGEYIVEISMVVWQGDAAYYFRVVVP